MIRHPFPGRLPSLVLAMSLVLASPPAHALTEADRIEALIPDGPVTAEVLTPDYSQRVQEISRRLINSAQADPVWFQNWIARHPNQPLPWHPKLGITKPEYDLYMREGTKAKRFHPG